MPDVSDAAVAARACLVAGKKAATCWVGVPGHAPRLVWAGWHADGICLVTGPGEQDVPGLAVATDIEVILRAPSTGATVLTLPARCEVLSPGSAQWSEVAAALAERRLNGAGTPTELLERWATDAALVRLHVG